MTAAMHAVMCPWSLLCLGAYALLVALVLGMNHAAHRNRTQRITGAYPECVPVWPVPTQVDIDETWLSIWPNAVDDDALCNAEFVSLINSNFYWPWPDVEDAS